MSCEFFDTVRYVWPVWAQVIAPCYKSPVLGGFFTLKWLFTIFLCSALLLNTWRGNGLCVLQPQLLDHYLHVSRICLVHYAFGTIPSHNSIEDLDLFHMLFLWSPQFCLDLVFVLQFFLHPFDLCRLTYTDIAVSVYQSSDSPFLVVKDAGDAAPRANPLSISLCGHSACQFWAASRIPYIE